jgi:hypothetical protein
VVSVEYIGDEENGNGGKAILMGSTFLRASRAMKAAAIFRDAAQARLLRMRALFSGRSRVPDAMQGT